MSASVKQLGNPILTTHQHLHTNVSKMWKVPYHSHAQFEKTYETRQKNVKNHVFGLKKNVKNVKNVEVITYRSIGLKTTMTTLNQFCCPSRSYQGHMWGLY